MAGAFTLGATDPKAGARSGAGSPLAMHATIHIEDIAAFVADPRHLAGLTGHIDFAPFGLALPSESGMFGLFSPSDDPALTYMVYELGFRHAHEDYYLAGKKNVRLGGPWGLWGETTTLYTTLHKGADASGEIVGAGILRLGVGALLKLLRTVHSSNAPTAHAGAGAVWRFFKFFTSELVRTYLRRAPR